MEQLVTAAQTGYFDLSVVDIADRRGIPNIGRFDLVNVVIAIRNGAGFLFRLVTHRPDVVYITIAQNRLGFARDLLFLLPARLFRRRIVVHLHGGNLRGLYVGSPGWLRWLMRATLQPARRAIVLGEMLRFQFDGLVAADRVVVVPNGVNVSLFPERISADSDGKHVIHVGALTQSKGTLDVIAAMKKVRRVVPSAHLTLAGEWYSETERADAVRLIEEGGLQNAVHMVGPVVGRAKVQLFMSADTLVLPTRSITSEGQPYVILEAMAAAVPVVTCAAGAIEEMLDRNVGGTIVAHGDIEALADAIIRYLENTDLRRGDGAAGRRRVVERFTTDRWAAKISALLHEVCAEQ